MTQRKNTSASKSAAKLGAGGELHQKAVQDGILTTNQGIPIADNQNQLKAGTRGPVLLEDFAFREKVFHFDHERIPERVVHARGTGAHGYFELYDSLSEVTSADLFQRPGTKTPAFVRFSTVVGGAGSIDTPRDVRGFAVKFYTQHGNWDLVGNNIPVFFIQDATKFPDLVHAAKMEADRGFPQAATAHDTFWDFVSLLPESTHMLMWAMSDRTLPRSYRTMEGFGVHTFRLINAQGQSTFVKFHWKPKLGLQSTLWDEAVKIAGADPDFHRRDLYQSIAQGQFPEWELGMQLFDQTVADSLPYDVLDATKLIPEEVVPVRTVGRLVLDRNVDNFFAETEQVAFCPANIVPGIDFSNDPLLQGRLFSYLDTQLKRLGSPNFHQLPVNRPQCPFPNFQRDGHMQTQVFSGRANYEPNSLASVGEMEGPRECPAGFTSYPDHVSGTKERIRPESFADHYSQARMFYRSMRPEEQAHIASAFVFELSKLAFAHVRTRMIGNLRNADEDLAQRVAAGIGMPLPEKTTSAAPVRELEASSALSIIGNIRETLTGRRIGVLIADGSDVSQVQEIVAAIEAEGAVATLIAMRVGQIQLSDGSTMDVEGQLTGTPSVLCDAVALVLSPAAASNLVHETAAVQFVSDAFAHLKAIGFTPGIEPLLERAGVKPDAGIVPVGAEFIEAAKRRYFSREPGVRHLP